MKNALSLLTIAVFSLSVLLAGCGNSEQAGSEPESSSSVRVETSLETVSPAEPETSESQPDVIVSEPLQQPASSVESESQTTDRETMAEEISAMNMMVQVGGSTLTLPMIIAMANTPSAAGMNGLRCTVGAKRKGWASP